MKNYFMSFVIKQKLPDGGFIDSGYGQVVSSAMPDVAINDVMCEMTSKIASQYNIDPKTVHITQFNCL